MSARSEDWTVTVEYPDADFMKDLSPERVEQRPRHSFRQRAETRYLVIYLNENNTTVGEVLRRLPHRLSDIEKMLAPSTIPVSIEIGLRGHSRPEELVSLSEIAELLDVTRQRAQQLSKHQDFPRPKGTPRSGPVYSRADAERYRLERTKSSRAPEQ